MPSRRRVSFRIEDSADKSVMDPIYMPKYEERRSAGWRSDSRWMNGVGQRRGKEWMNSGNKNDEKKQVVEIKEGRKEMRRRRSA